MFYCYVLESERTGRRYVGSCEDLNDRLKRHNARQSKATKHGVPWVVLHSELFETRRETVAKELYFKTGRAEMNWIDCEVGRRGDSPRPVDMFYCDSP